ncbi:MAG: heme lyase NrfEFG subunit NrfE, partial [Proteobacteria bacterium]|nr:heme lyase NrfEFG subunit NrfE [Pseudomonadota bacterium]
PGESLSHNGYDVLLARVEVLPGPNYEAQRASFEIRQRGRPLTTLTSERRYYPVREQMTTSAGIRTNLISNIYVTIGDPEPSGAFPVRFYYHPLVPWIWIGPLLMALGGFVSLMDRRLRVGMPQSAQKRSASVGAAPEPA